MPRTKLDKVFDNKFHETDPTEDISLNFHGSEFTETGESLNPINAVIVTELMSEIDNCIETKFIEFKKVKNSTVKRINKDDINVIYGYAKKAIPDKFTIVDIWYYLSVYFDINSTRFYECLLDEFKMELIDYLYTNTTFLKNKNMNNIF